MVSEFTPGFQIYYTKLGLCLYLAGKRTKRFLYEFLICQSNDDMLTLTHAALFGVLLHAAS